MVGEQSRRKKNSAKILNTKIRGARNKKGKGGRGGGGKRRKFKVESREKGGEGPLPYTSKKLRSEKKKVQSKGKKAQRKEERKKKKKGGFHRMHSWLVLPKKKHVEPRSITGAKRAFRRRKRKGRMLETVGKKRERSLPNKALENM